MHNMEKGRKCIFSTFFHVMHFPFFHFPVVLFCHFPVCAFSTFFMLCIFHSFIFYVVHFQHPHSDGEFCAQSLRLTWLRFVGKFTEKQVCTVEDDGCSCYTLNINPHADFFIGLRSIHHTKFCFGKL